MSTGNRASPKHQVERSIPSGGVGAGVVCHTHHWQQLLPVEWVVSYCGRKHMLEGLVKPLHEAVTLRVVWCGSRFADSQNLANLMHQLGFELTSLVRMQLFGRRETAEQFSHQLPCNRGSLLVRYGIGFSPTHKVVASNQDV